MNFIKRLTIISLGVLIIIFAIGSTFVSTGLSIAYFQSLTSDDMLTTVVFGFVILLQTMVLLGSISKGIIYKKAPQHFYTVKYFTLVCFFISVLSTISFFNSFDKGSREIVIKDLLYSIPFLKLNNNEWLVTNLTNMTLIWASCIVLDLMSMYFPAIGSDLISGISTRKKLEIKDKNYVMKIVDLITFYPKKWIDDKCYNLGIIESNPLQENIRRNEIPLQNKNSLHELITQDKNVMDDTLHDTDSLQKPITDRTHYKNSLQKPITCNENNVIENVMKEPIKPVNLDKKVCNGRNDYSNKKPISLQKTITKESKKCNEEIQLQNPITKPITCNEPNVMNNKNVMNKCNEDKNPLQELITNIDNFITENYKCNEKIKVGDVKKKFGLKANDRKWNDKIRDNLKSCKVINGRLTRIEDKKDTIKLVK